MCKRYNWGYNCGWGLVKGWGNRWCLGYGFTVRITVGIS